MARTLFISDQHLPFEHKKALRFCVDMANKHSVDRVIFGGDIVDHHRISRHTTEPDADGAVSEYRATLKALKRWYKAFPSARIVLGNHDLIPRRQAKELGIPRVFLKDLHEVYEMPKKWTLHDRIVENNVLYLHSAGSGKYGAVNKAREMSMSVVAGHTHRAGGIVYYSNPSHLYFGLNAGCLIDKSTYAMRYSNSEPTLGLAVVYSSERGYYEPMKLK
jgi:predicted phosphodiesterase